MPSPSAGASGKRPVMTPAADGTPLPPAGALLWGTLRRRWITLAAVVVAALGLVAVSFSRIGQNLVYYWGPNALQAAGGQPVGATSRLGGLVADGSVKRGQGASGVEFDVVDRAGAVTHVKCSGVPPQLFRERIRVRAAGPTGRAA